MDPKDAKICSDPTLCPYRGICPVHKYIEEKVNNMGQDLKDTKKLVQELNDYIIVKKALNGQAKENAVQKEKEEVTHSAKTEGLIDKFFRSATLIILIITAIITILTFWRG